MNLSSVGPRLFGSSGTVGWPNAVVQPRRLRSGKQKNTYLHYLFMETGSTCVANRRFEIDRCDL